MGRYGQLVIVDGVVCRHYSPDPTSFIVTVPILPPKLRANALEESHSGQSSGHLGTEKTLHRLQREAYWVYIARDVHQYCRECMRCQRAKPATPTRAPLTNVPIGKPWQMIAVDVLEVSLSTKNNHYLLVIQDYFTKWAEAIPMPNQTASRITVELVKLIARMGMPEILHSDQGRNFESTLLQQTLEAFGIRKSRTTAYHPQGDGMVERFNRSILQMLRAYIDTKEDWEEYLPLVLCAYRTAVHSSTGVSPFQLIYGREPKFTAFSESRAFDSTTYQGHLQAKLAELRDFVHVNLTEAANKQKIHFDKHSKERQFQVGDLVWLSIPTAGKLDPRWEGKWVIKSILSPLTIEISDGKRCRVVHINRLRHQIDLSSVYRQGRTEEQTLWTPPQTDHQMITEDHSPQSHSSTSQERNSRYPLRVRKQPDWYIGH